MSDAERRIERLLNKYMKGRVVKRDVIRRYLQDKTIRDDRAVVSAAADLYKYFLSTVQEEDSEYQAPTPTVRTEETHYLDDVRGYQLSVMDDTDQAQHKLDVARRAAAALTTDALEKKAYVCLDTAFARADFSETNKVSWYYIPTITRAETTGVVQSFANTRWITRIKLYSGIFPNRDINQNTRRVSILFDEFRSVAPYVSATRRYHFLTRIFYTDANSSDSHVDLQTEDFNDGIFEFAKPVAVPDTFTLSFADPSADIPLYRTAITGRVTTYANPTVITTDVPHNITTSSYVFITGFTTNTPSFDDSQVNNIYGLPAGVTSATTFTISVDTSSGSVSFIANQPVNIVIQDHRIIIPMEITYLENYKE